MFAIAPRLAKERESDGAGANRHFDMFERDDGAITAREKPRRADAGPTGAGPSVSEVLQGKSVAPPPASPWLAKERLAAGLGRDEIVQDDAVFDLIELFFFAYRDFVGDADRLLENYDFGRAHHRVLHFVNRRPGLAIAALLDILKITKQSLNRVLKQLLDAGFVEARAGAADRRQRLLYPTVKGAKLARELAALQSERFLRVMNELRPEARGVAADFLFAMIDEAERERVRAHLTRARGGSRVAKAP
jgi:DNA-binding MarR family transcriptional regulator